MESEWSGVGVGAELERSTELLLLDCWTAGLLDWLTDWTGWLDGWLNFGVSRLSDPPSRLGVVEDEVQSFARGLR